MLQQAVKIVANQVFWATTGVVEASTYYIADYTMGVGVGVWVAWICLCT